MEQVLDAYKRPYDPLRPLICMDESPRQLIRAVRLSLKGGRGKVEREDYEYERCGVCNVFMAIEPLAGKRLVRVTERKTRTDWAKFLEEIAGNYTHAEKITLVMDNLNTHTAGSLYEAFLPEQAKSLWGRFEFIYTPKHGSWLIWRKSNSMYSPGNASLAAWRVWGCSEAKLAPGRCKEIQRAPRSIGSLQPVMPGQNSNGFIRHLLNDMTLVQNSPRVYDDMG